MIYMLSAIVRIMGKFGDIFTVFRLLLIIVGIYIDKGGIFI